MGLSAPNIFIVPSSQRHRIAPLIEAKKESYVVVNDKFIETLNRPERYQLLRGGAGSSKSDTKATDLLIKCMTKPFFKLMYCRKYKTQIRESQFSLFTKIIKRQNWQPYFSFSEAENSSMIIKCTLNNNVMIPMGLDNIDKLTSIDEFTDIWVEEPLAKKSQLANVTLADFNELDRRIRTLNASTHIHMTFNPVSMNNWLYETFFDKTKETYYQFYPEKINKGAKVLTYSHHSTFKDNAFIDHEAEESKFARSGSYEYRIFALGEWGLLRADTPYFYEFSMDKHVHDINFNPLKPFILSFDFNLDIMSCSVWQVSDPKVYCCYEFPPVTGLDERCNTILTSPFMPYLDYCTITGDATGGNRDQKTPHMSHYALIKKRLNLRSDQMKVPRSNMFHSDSRLLCNSVMRNADFAIDRKCINMQADFQMTENDGNDGIDKKKFDPHYGDTARAVCQSYLQKYLRMVQIDR